MLAALHQAVHPILIIVIHTLVSLDRPMPTPLATEVLCHHHHSRRETLTDVLQLVCAAVNLLRPLSLPFAASTVPILIRKPHPFRLTVMIPYPHQRRESRDPHIRQSRFYPRRQAPPLAFPAISDM